MCVVFWKLWSSNCNHSRPICEDVALQLLHGVRCPVRWTRESTAPSELDMHLCADLRAQTRFLLNRGSDNTSLKDNSSNCMALKKAKRFICRPAHTAATSSRFIANIITFSLLNAECAPVSGAAGLAFYVLSTINRSPSFTSSVWHETQGGDWRNTGGQRRPLWMDPRIMRVETVWAKFLLVLTAETFDELNVVRCLSF